MPANDIDMKWTSLASSFLIRLAVKDPKLLLYECSR